MNRKSNEQVVKVPGHTYRQWALTVLANMTLFSYGLDIGWISPMAKILQSDQSPTGEPLSDTMLSWTASSICLAAVFTVPIYTYIADRFGSRSSVIAIAIPQAMSCIIRLCFASAPSLIISRVLSGVAAGGCFNAVVIYVKEISQDSLRGTLSSMLVLFQNSGVFIMYMMGVYLDYYTVLWIVTGIPVVTGILLYKAPDSPAFLVKQGKIEEATATVAFLRGLDKDDKIVTNEVTIMTDENDKFKNLPNMSLRNIVKNPIWRREMTVLALIISVQATNGAFALTTYASVILSSTGVEFTVSVETLTLTIPAVLIFGSTVSILCIEKIGRKTLNIIMLSITACSMLSIAVSMLIKNQGGTVPSWLPVLSMMVAVWAYACGICPIPFIIMVEMFSFQIRAKVFGIIVTLSWFMSFLPIVGYVPLSNAIGIHNIFFVFTVMNITGVMLSLFFLPETRAKSVVQIEREIAVRLGLDNPEKVDVTEFSEINYLTNKFLSKTKS